MKTIIKLIVVLALIGCQQQALEVPGTEMIIIEKGNDTTYFLGDLENPGAGWQEKKNGNAYLFEVNQEIISLQSDRPMQSATYFKNTMDKKGTVLPVEANKVATRILENGVFKIEY